MELQFANLMNECFFPVAVQFDVFENLLFIIQ